MIDKDVIKLILVGDIMLSRGVGSRIKKYGGMFPFKKTASILGQGDIVFGNLESPISDNGEYLDKKYVFRADPESIKGLLSAGFDIVSLANNHILDAGKNAVDNTKDILEKNKINFIGMQNKGEINQRPIIIERDKIKFGFLAYTKVFPKQFKDLYPGPFPFIEENVLQDIRNAKEQVDFLIVSVHWGEEYNLKSNKEQKRIAESMIDNGADIIHGHHPHVLQPIEKYKDSLIIYSLGNFVFDQIRYKGVKDSLILKISIDKDKIKNIEKIPIYINDDHQPELK